MKENSKCYIVVVHDDEKVEIDLNKSVAIQVINILKMNRMPMTQHKFDLISKAIASNKIETI